MDIAILPSGTLYIETANDSSTEYRLPGINAITQAFAVNTESGLLELANNHAISDLSASCKYWQEFGQLFMSQLCLQEDLERPVLESAVAVPAENLRLLALSVPPMKGGEYVSVLLLENIWAKMNQWIHQEAVAGKGTIRDFIKIRFPSWAYVGRVYFHLAENTRNPAIPFAFLATYTTRVSSSERVKHLPLGKALQEYAGQKNKAALLALLKPVQKATQESEFLKGLVDSGQIYQPMAWYPAEAYQFLKAIPQFEASGIIVRVPNNWQAKRPARAQVTASIGNSRVNRLDSNAMLDFNISLSIDGETLNVSECREILNSTEKLILLKGKWVEIDKDKLQIMLDHWNGMARQIKDEGLSVAEGMRLLSGVSLSGKNESATEITPEWSQVIAGAGLADLLRGMKEPMSLGAQSGFIVSEALRGQLHAELRGYQDTGVHWLWYLYSLGLGACLADDMGLGKTIQVLSLLLLIQKANQQMKKTAKPHLLVLPASLIGNWVTELTRFAPGIRYLIAHRSVMNKEQRAEGAIVDLKNVDIVLTTYGSLLRTAWLQTQSWDLVILDEAQAIKNPHARQTRTVKMLKANNRIVLTGTPLENRLSDLWSLFDFINPGLLGSEKSFGQFVKSRAGSEHNAYAPLRQLVQPYILRRLKSDKSIITDLPDKTELKSYCTLSKRQAVLYQQSVEDLRQKLDEPLEGIKRKGLILAYLLRFKQICNHPAQWLGDGSYEPADSGKFQRLAEICETITARQEKVLVFTQFREITAVLHDFLSTVFGRQGLILHGGTPVPKRKALVDQFQDELGPPFFILSIKAGGTGLNLTAAAHVIHFDRWWNPAVENQATDRAYRIGQKKNILVHKFVCQGTIEDKIDRLIEEKKSLAEDILGGGGEAILTELDDQALLKLVSLDLSSAMGE